MSALNFSERELAELLRQNPAFRINPQYSQLSTGYGQEMIIPTEEEEQERLAADLDDLGLRWCHVPNGGYRDFKTAKLLRRLGVKPGVPDILIFNPPPAFPGRPGTVIEMKRQFGGKISAYQKDWLSALRELNWYTAVAEGYQKALEVLRECGYIK